MDPWILGNASLAWIDQNQKLTSQVIHNTYLLDGAHCPSAYVILLQVPNPPYPSARGFLCVPQCTHDTLRCDGFYYYHRNPPFVEKGPERARGAHGAYKESIKEKMVDPTDMYQIFGHEDDRSDLANQGCINSPKLMHPTVFYYFKLVSYIW